MKTYLYITLSGYPKAPLPLFSLILSVACIYRGLLAFFPKLRRNKRKKREPVPKTKGILYILVGSAGAIYSIYVIYAFLSGNKEAVKFFETIILVLMGIWILDFILFKKDRK